MEKTMCNRINQLKNHVYNNRGKYAMLSTAVVFTWIASQRAKEWNEFLKEQGVYDEFYAGREE
jgi:hypothetical protein